MEIKLCVVLDYLLKCAWLILFRPNQLVHPNPTILRVATSVKQGSAVLPWAPMIPSSKFPV